MAAEQTRIPAPSRPVWVTDELVARWCAWVRRDVTRHGNPAPEPVTLPVLMTLKVTVTVSPPLTFRSVYSNVV